MSQEQESTDIKDILRRSGWVEDAASETKEPEPEESTEKTIEIPADLLAQLKPEEKERVRNLPGGAFAGEEAKPEDKVDPWSRHIPELGKVTVSKSELEAYTRALLFDERFELPIRLFFGSQPVEFVVRSLYVAEREVMAMALNKVTELYPIKTIQNAALVAEHFLRMSLAVQVVSMDGVSMDPIEALPQPGIDPATAPEVDKLVEASKLRFAGMHQAKIKTMIRALHTFETKQTILEDAYFNRDFPSPADAY